MCSSGSSQAGPKSTSSSACCPETGRLCGSRLPLMPERGGDPTTCAEIPMSERPKAFALSVSDQAITDLRERLARTRFPDQAPGEAWGYGTDVAYLRRLVDYWRDTFDWRAEEARLNAFVQGKVALDGIGLHYLHVPGVGPDPLPLLLMHGWPGSVFEFLEIIPQLADPGRFGGDPADAFTVVAPSLPGFGLSFAPGQRRF